ncbi:MAG: SCP2 sterol-binding domain-containing protein [Chloroflexi bacterium]|nr:SCP2 sterol-binding domain-containing protein [Chloroflexota bacterium]MBP8059296.1 SCP2 sterol-binding domain-containing protein [Chloroflexota bacterium]
MAIYRDTEQFYTCAQKLFAQIQQNDPHAAATLLQSRLVIRLQFTQPNGVILLSGRGQTVETHFGTNSLKSDLDINLSGDTLHAILLGQITLTKALGSGKLGVKGPVWKATVLADLFRQSQTLYPQILRDQGIS